MAPLTNRNTGLWKRAFKITFKIAAWLVLVPLILLVLVWALFLIPKVQRYATQEATEFLSKKLQTEVRLSNLTIDFPKAVALTELYIEDQKQDTLLYAGKISVDINLWDLLNQKIYLSSVELSQITAHISRNLPGDNYNFSFIPKAFAGKEKKDTSREQADTTGTSWEFGIGAVDLEDIHFRFHDQVGNIHADLDLNLFTTSFETFDLGKTIFHLNTLKLDTAKIMLAMGKPTFEQSIDTSTAKSELPDIQLRKIELSGIALRYKNTQAMQNLDLLLGNFYANFRKLDLKNSSIDLKTLRLTHTQLVYTQGKTQADTTQIKAPDNRPAGSMVISDWLVNADNIAIENTNLIYNDQNKEVIKDAFDPAHIAAKELNLEARDFSLGKQHVTLNLENLKFREDNGLALNAFKGKLHFDSTRAEIKDLELEMNETRIGNYISVRYPSLQSLTDSIAGITLESRFRDTRFALKDVMYFYPQLLDSLPLKPEAKNSFVRISGNIKGGVHALELSKLDVRTADNTRAELDGSLRNLLETEKLHASLSFNLASSKKDLASLLQDSLLPKQVSLPDTFSVKGAFTGYLKNFDANAKLESSFGTIGCKVKMYPDVGRVAQVYEGKIETENFNAGKLLQQKDLGAITLSAGVKGSGFDTSSIKAQLELSVARLIYKDYTYQNFKLDGQLNKQAFTGAAAMKDKNLSFDFKGDIDLDPMRPNYTFSLDLTGADLRGLNLSESDLRVSALLRSDIGTEKGKNVTGTASISKLLIVRNGRKYPVDSIVLSSGTKDGVSELSLRSDIVTADFKGEIVLNELPQALKQHINSYFNLHATDTLQKLARQKFDFRVDIINPDILTTHFFPDLEKLTPGSVKGSYNSETRNVKLDLDIAQVKYNGLTVDTVKFQVNSDRQKMDYALRVAEIVNPTFRSQNVSLSGELKNNSLSFHFVTAKDDSVKQFDIAGGLKSLNKEFELKLEPRLVLNTESWNMSGRNYIRFGSAGMYANDFVLARGTQVLSLNSRDKTYLSPMELSFRNFEITTVSSLVENKKDFLAGTINGNIILEKQNATPAFKSDLTISNFVFQSVPIGTIKLKASNYTESQKYDVDLSVEGNGNQLALKGFYRANASRDLDLTLDILNLNLASVEPFTFGQVNRMTGSLNGQLNLKGPSADPKVNGEIRLKEAGFKPKVMDSYLTVQTGKVRFASRKLYLDQFTIKDSLGHVAVLSGNIDANDLKNIGLDLRLKTDQFLVLNTTREDNALYYGTIILDSDIKIRGSLDAPTVDAKIKLDKGTTLTYVKPESLLSKDESKGVVDFINPNNKEISIMARRNDSLEGISKMKGIELNASVNVDRSVQLKIIVDPSTGDSLYVQGGGLLDFGLDRSGKTTLAGKYNITDGGYFLSLENLVKRSFKIQKGSSITWSGDIFDAYVDLTAIYFIKTSPLDLVQNELSAASELEKNKYRNMLTFLVYLKMTGFLSSPEISFDIQLSPGDRGAMGGAINTRLAQLREDETQLNKQVFALLTLRRFVGENPLESSSDGGISSASRSSASKVLTQQLSNLSDKYVNFVDLDVGVNSFEDYSTGQAQGRTQVQLGVSKQLFNEKVTIRVGGNVDVEGERAAQNNANDVAGNISIDYRLTEDGRYKLKASRENQYENPIEGELTKTAAGIVFERNFNTFKQLIKGPEKRVEKKTEEKKEDEK